MDTKQWEHLTHLIHSYNPYARRDRQQALPATLWAAFGHYLEQADTYAVLYYPPDPGVEPLLARGATVAPTYLSPKAREMRGALTPEVRTLLWGRGEGQLPWYVVELFRDGQRVFAWTEHESHALIYATGADLQELQRRGAEPELIRPWDGPPSRQRRTADDAAVSPAVSRDNWPGPLERLPSHRIDRPARDEWLRMLALVGQRADRFYCTWLGDVPGANGWRGDQGRERLTPLAETVTPQGVAGPVTPAVLAALAAEPPGPPDLEHGWANWQPGDVPPAPWWHLLLVSGRDVLLESHYNGWYVDLRLTREEWALLDDPHGRLRDVEGPRRQHIFNCLSRMFAIPHRRENREGLQELSEGMRYWELRRGGDLLVSLRIEPEALARLWPYQRAQFLLRDAPRQGQVIIECHGDEVRWRHLDAPPEPPTAGR